MCGKQSSMCALPEPFRRRGDRATTQTLKEVELRQHTHFSAHYRAKRASREEEMGGRDEEKVKEESKRESIRGRAQEGVEWQRRRGKTGYEKEMEKRIAEFSLLLFRRTWQGFELNYWPIMWSNQIHQTTPPLVWRLSETRAKGLSTSRYFSTQAPMWNIPLHLEIKQHWVRRGCSFSYKPSWPRCL